MLDRKDYTFDVENGGDFLVDEIASIGATKGLRIWGVSGGIMIKNFACDTLSNPGVGIEIDDSHDIVIQSARGFTNFDAFWPAELAYGVRVGANTNPSTKNKNIRIRWAARSTGGTGLYIANCEDCSFHLELSNARSFTDVTGYHPIWRLVEYGTGNSGSLYIFADTIGEIGFVTSGTRYGILEVMQKDDSGIRRALYGTLLQIIDGSPTFGEAIIFGRAGDSQPWLILTPDGTFLWGGGSGPPDVVWERLAAALLQLSASLQITNNLTVLGNLTVGGESTIPDVDQQIQDLWDAVNSHSTSIGDLYAKHYDQQGQIDYLTNNKANKGIYPTSEAGDPLHTHNVDVF
ncbi:MAG: hypothetical protein HY313_11070 [Acidobacteria bacterium]|nr:hypothetical protein [Acidobacteriota bacterium]